MAEGRIQRRLAAILAADVVGYSRLMEQDETNTLAQLKKRRKEVLRPIVAKHQGRIFKYAGDGVLAEFSSAVDAVECAIDLQLGMVAANSDQPEDRHILLRIGVNLGDIMVEGSDLYGDGVNIAARLEGIAKPSSILISGAAFDYVRNKVKAGFEDLGLETLKNLSQPVRVYRILPEGTVPPRASVQRGKQHPWDRAAVVLAVTLLIALVGGLAWFLYSMGPAVEQPQGIPVIAVIPFQDLTGDQTSKDLGKGIAEAFMTNLATFPDYEVVSASTSFAFADKPLSEIVQATGATFVVEGSVRRAADTLRVTMQLIRGSSDRHLMVAEIEEPITDPVSLQTAVASRLNDKLGGMTGVLRRESNRIALAKDPSELTEYDYYTLGHIKSFLREWDTARDIWTKGLERFPDSVLLRCKLAFYHLRSSDKVTVERLVNEARELKKKSRLDEWYLHWASARWEMAMRQDTRRAVAEAEATVAMAPYDTVSKMDLSAIMIGAGRKDEAVSWATYAMTHDPSPLRWYPDNLLNAYRSAGKLTDLVELSERETKRQPPSKLWYEVLGQAYLATGQSEKAVEAFHAAGSIPNPPQD